LFGWIKAYNAKAGGTERKSEILAGDIPTSSQTALDRNQVFVFLQQYLGVGQRGARECAYDLERSRKMRPGVP